MQASGVGVESEFRLMKCHGNDDDDDDRISDSQGNKCSCLANTFPNPQLEAPILPLRCSSGPRQGPLGSSSNSHVTKPSKFNSFEIRYALHIFNDFFRLPLSLHNTRFDELPTIPIRCDTNRIPMPCCTHHEHLPHSVLGKNIHMYMA